MQLLNSTTTTTAHELVVNPMLPALLTTSMQQLNNMCCSSTVVEWSFSFIAVMVKLHSTTVLLQHMLLSKNSSWCMHVLGDHQINYFLTRFSPLFLPQMFLSIFLRLSNFFTLIKFFYACQIFLLYNSSHI